MQQQTAATTASGKRVFLVDDDEFFRESLAQSFASAGFEVETASDGEAALRHLASAGEKKADVVILDWKMPGLTGIEVLQRAREVGVQTPVIFLTSLREPIYEQSALEKGAVDFIEKSRSFGILLKRVELILNSVTLSAANSNAANGGHEPLVVGALELRPAIHRAQWEGQEVSLTLTEFNIVKFMAANAGKDVHFKDIHHLVHREGFAVGYGPEGYRGNVRTFIKRIRKKFREIDEQFDAIENYPGFGYRWRQS
jgi:two-component system response regulator ChvI